MDRRLFIAQAALSTYTIASAGSPDQPVAEVPARGSLSKPLWSWTAAEIARGLRARAISSREVTESCLDRLRVINPQVNAVAEVLEVEALRAADAADRRLAKGPRAELPVLLGVPVTTKINVDLAGHATTDGVVALRQKLAKEDHSSVANLRKGGAVILGRTNTPAFSFRWFTENDLHGRTLNPWDPTVTPGGSSGGAASAVAVGIGPIAHGNDIAGSVRYPAFCCGVAGIRPTAGLVPSFNPSSAQNLAGISAQLMGVQGLLARSVNDLRLALPVLAQQDVRDPTILLSDRGREPLPRRARIAVLRELPGVKTDPSVTAGLDAAAQSLRSAGYIVEEVVPPRFQEAADLWSPFVLSEIGAGLNSVAQKLGDVRIQEALRTWLGVTNKLDLAGFSEVLGKRFQMRREWSVFLQDHPVVITPASWREPFALDFDQQGPEAFREILSAQSPSLVIAFLGLPGLAVPTGIHQGIPTGVQVVAEWFREDRCFEVGSIIEANANMGAPIDPRSIRAV